MNKTLFLFASLCLFTFSALGQNKKEKEATRRALIEERIELLNETLDENGEVDLTVLFDNLNNLLDHPLNLNTASLEDLNELFFLNDIQIQAIISHRNRYGDFISIYELKQVRSLNKESIYFMLPFVTIEEKLAVPKKSLKSLVDGSRSELWLRYQRQLQDQRGFLENESGETSYRGSADKLYLRYRFTNGSKFSFGITGEKDAGEEFFKGSKSERF